MKITDGAGGGYGAAVNSNNQLSVNAINETAQHFISHGAGEAYQAWGVTDTLTSATIPILHLKNTSTTKDMVITYVRFQTVDSNETLPAAASYFQMSFGRTYSSGGTAMTPVNMNTSSGNAAETTAYQSTPVLAGTAVEFDRVYNPADGQQITYNKEGSIIVGPNDTIEFTYVGTSTAGVAYCRCSFYFAVHN